MTSVLVARSTFEEVAQQVELERWKVKLPDRWAKIVIESPTIAALDPENGDFEAFQRRKNNEQLLAVLEEEQNMEEGRELTMQRVDNGAERSRLEKMYGIERARASERIMRITEEHEMVLAAKMAELGLVR